MYSKLLPTDLSASCFGMCNTRCLAHGWEAGHWRQHPREQGCCADFPGATFYVCSPHLAQWESQHEKSGSPEDQYPVVQGTAGQQASRFTSAQVDCNPAGNTSLAGFGLCPSVALWKNYASEGLATFHIPREAAHWPLGILTLHSISLAGNTVKWGF